MRYYRVFFGFGKDDFLSIPETELAKAINAQGTGKVAMLETGTLSGSQIHRIVPDYQRMMGWSRDHQLGSDDYKEIGSKMRRECEEIYLLSKTNVERHLKGLPPIQKLEPSTEAKQLADKFKIGG